MQGAHDLGQLGQRKSYFRARGEMFQAKIHRVRARFLKRLAAYGLSNKAILYSTGDGDDAREYIGLSRSVAEGILRRADLLLNFHYAISPALLARFRRRRRSDLLERA